MENFIIVIVVALILGCSLAYVIKAKKKGVKCVGCPYAETCGKNTENNSCSCNTNK